jgi:hypothetical protein
MSWKFPLTKGLHDEERLDNEEESSLVERLYDEKLNDAEQQNDQESGESSSRIQYENLIVSPEFLKNRFFIVKGKST